MRCWKCGKEIPSESRFCSFCGADQQRPAPETEAGRAMRAISGRHGLEAVLSDENYLLNELGEYLDDAGPLCSQIELAMAAGLGQTYLQQLSRGEPDARFAREARELLTEKAGLSESAADGLVRAFHEMVGWPLPRTESAPRQTAAPQQQAPAPQPAVPPKTQAPQTQTARDAKALRRRAFFVRWGITFGIILIGSLLGYLYKTYLAPQDVKLAAGSAPTVAPTTPLVTPLGFVPAAKPTPQSWDQVSDANLTQHAIWGVYALPAEDRTNFVLLFYDAGAYMAYVSDVLLETCYAKSAGYTQESVIEMVQPFIDEFPSIYSGGKDYFNTNEKYINWTTVYHDVNTPEHLSELKAAGRLGGFAQGKPMTAEQVEKEILAEGYVPFTEIVHDYPLVYYAQIAFDFTGN